MPTTGCCLTVVVRKRRLKSREAPARKAAGSKPRGADFGQRDEAAVGAAQVEVGAGGRGGAGERLV